MVVDVVVDVVVEVVVEGHGKMENERIFSLLVMRLCTQA